MMKRNTMLRTACAMLALFLPLLAACGDDGANDPNLGVYEAKSAEMMGIELSVDEVFEDGCTIELKKKGKGTMTFDGDEADFKWELDGNDFSGKGSGAELSGTLEDGILVLKDIMGSGVTMTLVCDDIAKENSTEAAEKEPAKEEATDTEPAAEEGAAGNTKSASFSDAVGFRSALEGKTSNASGSGDEIPMELMARYEGDWHGIMYFYNATGSFAALDGKKCDIAARFSLDEKGNVTPYLISAKKELGGGMNFHDITAELDPYFDCLYFSGKIMGDGSIEYASVGEEDGLLHTYFTVTGPNDSSMDIEFAMRHPDVPWKDSDYPMYPKEGYDYYKGCSLEQVIASFQSDGDTLPEKTNITGWE